MRRCQTIYEQFLASRDDALFHGTISVGANLSGHLAKTTEAAKRALDFYQVSLGNAGPPVVPGSRPAKLRAEVTRECYELLLVLADAEARAVPRDGERSHQANARRALRVLDRAAALGASFHPTHAYHSRRALYLEMADTTEERQKADGERDRAKTRLPSSALDYYLSGDEKYKDAKRWEEAIPDFERAV